jgi:hypothetical protein
MGTVTTTPTQRELEQLRYERELRRRSIATHYQVRADAVFAEWGTKAKARIEGQDPEGYRRDLCVQAKKLLPYSDDRPSPDYKATFRDLRSLKLWSMSPEVFAGFEPQIYQAAAAAYARDDTVPLGEMRAVTKVDPVTGYKETRFYGREHFCKAMNREGRRVTSFRAGDRFFDTSGRPWAGRPPR